jgi:uncharacterized membrane protein YeaQ/YmgE (transglycosylase-associated protein family)
MERKHRLERDRAAAKLIWIKPGIHRCNNLALHPPLRATSRRARERRRIVGILSWIILGLIAGFIGSKIVDRQGQGFWLNMALGIVGALVGGFLFDLFGASGVTGLNLYSMIVAVAGSVVVLLVYNALMGQRRA